MITRNLNPKKVSPYPNTTVCKNCCAIFGNGLAGTKVKYGTYEEGTSSNFHCSYTVVLAKGECPVCRYINKED